MRDDTRVWPLLTELASCLCAELGNAGLPDLCFCGVIPGDVAFDHCGTCGSGECGGMAWVSPQAIVPSEALQMSSGITIAAPRRCQTPNLTVAFEVGVMRCAPMPDDDGQPPSLADFLDAARLQMADMAASERALLCCFADPPTLGGWNSVGPEGGCLGGIWLATFTLEL